MKFVPVYDKGYYPMIVKLNEFRSEVAKSAHKPFSVCIERNKGYNFIYSLDIFADEKAMEELGVKAEINLEQTTVILEGDGLLIKTAIDEIYDLGFTPQEI